jgi:hypothetical protein
MQTTYNIQFTAQGEKRQSLLQRQIGAVKGDGQMDLIGTASGIIPRNKKYIYIQLLDVTAVGMYNYQQVCF